MTLQVKEAERSDLCNLIMNNKLFFYKRFSYSTEILPDFVINDLISSLKDKDVKTIIQLGLFDSKGRIHGGVSVYLSEWDTQHFKIKIGKTAFLFFDKMSKLEDRLNFFRKLREKLVSSEFRAIFLRHSLNDSKTIIALSKSGWILTDVLLTFHRNMKAYVFTECKEKLPIKIRDANKYDSNAISDLARKSFHTSHFHLDPNLPHNLSDELYANWALSSLNKLSSKVFVAEEDNGICGFISCSINQLASNVSYGVIDLIAVDSDKQKRGIGKLLLSEALKWFSSQVCSVYVGTQAINIPAVRLYESMGFRQVNAEATFHFWNQ